MPPRKIDLVLYGKNLNGDTMFVNPQARKQWAEQFAGEQWMCKFELIGSLNDKRRLFAYLHGPLLDTALAWFETTGQYDYIDKVKLYYDFKRMFAQYTTYNQLTKQEEVDYYDYSSDRVSVDLLKKFLDDIIRFLEQEFPPTETNAGFQAPDSEAYKTRKRYGSGFTSKKNQQFKNDQQ